MASTVPALRGTFGSYEYWLTTMHVSDLIKSVTIPKDDPEWEDLSLEERYQRDINVARVKREIAPYFANEPDRFTGALILAVRNHDDMTFEPLSNVGSGTARMPKLYEKAAADLGFLTYSGAEVFVPLDGQHRAKALKYALQGSDDNGNAIPNVEANTELGTENVAVILVRHDKVKSRRIFSKVNRYAKPTTKGQNLVIDDDDAVAVATRNLLKGRVPLDSRLVRFQSSALSLKAAEFTTLDTLYEGNMSIIKARCWAKGKPEGADVKQREIFEDVTAEVWCLLLNGLQEWADATADPSMDGDAKRIDLRQRSLLGRPVGQRAVVQGFVEACLRMEGDTASEPDLCERLNRIPWEIEDPLWQNVLVHPNGRLMSGKTTINTAALFVAHLLGAELGIEQRAQLVEQIAGSTGAYELPDPVV